MCTARDPVVHYYARDYARRTRMFGGINFGDLVKKIRKFAKLNPRKSFRLYGIHLNNWISFLCVIYCW